MSLQDQESARQEARQKLSWLERKMCSSRFWMLRRIFHFLHFYVRPLLLALIVLFLAAVSFMLTVWFPILRSSPKGFEPVFRISVLDWIQARALGRSAEASEAENDFDAAKMSWQLATRNDPGNPKWPRGWLSNVRHEKPSWRTSLDAAVYSFHLLRLSPTNRANFALVANTMEHCRRYHDVVSLFQSEDVSISPEQKAPLLRSLFHLGDHKDFRDHWSALQLQTPRIDWLEEPLMKLYHLGNKAILENDPGSLGDLNQAVAAITPSSPHYAAARRIALRATVAAGDVPAVRKILEDLRRRQEATCVEDLLFWNLLISQGSPNEIAQDLENSSDPITEEEAMALLQTLESAGLVEEMLKTAEELVDQIGADSPDLWFAYGGWLIHQGKWTILRDLARQASRIAEIESIALYWEGLIEWERERYDQARERFLTIADFPPRLLQIRGKLAEGLLENLRRKKDADALYETIDKTVEVLAEETGQEFLKSRQVALRVAIEEGDLPAARKILEDLRRRQEAVFSDTLLFWQLLIAKGTPEEIAQDLENSDDPVTEQEARDLLQTLLQAGLVEEAEKAAKKSLDQMGDRSIYLWLEYGDLLIQRGKLDQLSELSQQIFKTSFESDEIKREVEPIALYWEGFVALREGRRDQAQERFSKIAQLPPLSWQIRSELAWRLVSLSQNELAESLASGLDGRIGNVREYWKRRVQQSGAARKWEAFFQDAQAAYESDPTFPDHVYSHLVALLQKRKDPELALSLSDQLVQWQPNNFLFQLIHAHSLLQNEKYEEAEAILQNISLAEEAAETPLAGDYNMALFKLAAGKGQNEEVLRLYKTLNLENYMPETAQWVKETIAKISQAGGTIENNE